MPRKVPRKKVKSVWKGRFVFDVRVCVCVLMRVAFLHGIQVGLCGVGGLGQNWLTLRVPTYG